MVCTSLQQFQLFHDRQMKIPQPPLLFGKVLDPFGLVLEYRKDQVPFGQQLALVQSWNLLHFLLLMQLRLEEPKILTFKLQVICQFLVSFKRFSTEQLVNHF